ncbi:MAG: hypothetical protein Q7T69_11475 [Rhodoferax sp.]|nr:hypothetical protein [Rhodoferax sp.]
MISAAIPTIENNRLETLNFFMAWNRVKNLASCGTRAGSIENILPKLTLAAVGKTIASRDDVPHGA